MATRHYQLTSSLPAGMLTIAAKATHPTCVQNSNLSVGVTTANQINNGGFVYDAAGNLTNTPNPGGLTMVYDAENRMTSTAGVSYTYDGDGKRVKKTGGRLYWYGLSNDTLFESDLSGSVTDEYVFFGGKRIARRQNPSGTVHYYASDHLGTSRVVMSAAGGILDDSDFQPFGREIVVTASSGNTYKFTGKERDSESGLDYFGARYYASTMGRYLSPDWSETPQPVPYADFGNPQTLNLYQYVGNNPITTFDADGHCWPPSACADALDSFVQTFRQDGLAANDRTSSPTVAAINTFANGVVGDLASGAADVLRLGNGTAAAIDSAKQGDYLGAAANLAQDGGRAATVILTVTAIGARANAPTGETLQPGPNAGESVPASGPRANAAQQQAINQIGRESGCHTCGSTNPGTKSGNWVKDHQPPTALANGRPQTLYPQCLSCSRLQGGQVRAAQQAGRQIPPRQPPPPLIRQKRPEEK